MVYSAAGGYELLDYSSITNNINQMVTKIRYFILPLLLVATSLPALAGNTSMIGSLNFSNEWQTVKDDYREFYSRDRLLHMGMAFGAGAIVANTHMDESFQKWYQTDIRGNTTDDIAGGVKNFGEWQYLIPASFGAAVLDKFIDGEQYHSSIGRWGSRSARAYIVGTPMLLLTQALTGASRPSEGRGSNWRPFDNTHGVSGHAFVGAVPFLTIARMNEDNRVVKYLFYGASTLTALSRINDNAHYLSQAGLGWFLAWEATDTVADRDGRKKIAFTPMPVKDGSGVYVSMQW